MQYVISVQKLLLSDQESRSQPEEYLHILSIMELKKNQQLQNYLILGPSSPNIKLDPIHKKDKQDTDDEFTLSLIVKDNPPMFIVKSEPFRKLFCVCDRFKSCWEYLIPGTAGGQAGRANNLNTVK